jgi:hypothetical protein
MLINKRSFSARFQINYVPTQNNKSSLYCFLGSNKSYKLSFIFKSFFHSSNIYLDDKTDPLNNIQKYRYDAPQYQQVQVLPSDTQISEDLLF